jgi:mannose-6-phosphate isomerase
MTLCPARLEPTFSPRPWGALSLAPFFPGMSNLAEPIGEAWMTGNECLFVNGPFAGQKLSDAWPEMPPAWTGTAVPCDGLFHLLVKFIFSEGKLSVQVHPDDDYAARHEQAAGSRGKTEMWYAVRARPGAEVLVGLKADVSAESFRRAIAESIAEDCLEHIPLHSGDAVFVPARTAHTIGPGLVLCEIQQHCDLTYRVYDYNRRDARGQMRALHIDKALEVIRFGKQCGGKIEPIRVQHGPVTETHYAACRYFATEKWEFTEKIEAASSSEHFDLLIFLEGNGNIRWGAESAEYGLAQAWLIPAALGGYELAPDVSSKTVTSLLRTFVPSDVAEIGRQLSAHGVTEQEWSRLIYR